MSGGCGDCEDNEMYQQAMTLNLSKLRLQLAQRDEEIEQLKQRLEIAEKELQAWEKYAEDEGIIISAEKE